MENNNIESNEKNELINYGSKMKKLLIIIASVLIVIIACTLGYISSVKNKVESWNDKIYTGVTVHGVDLSGKTKEEAVETLNGELITQISGKKINVTVGDENFQLNYGDINPAIDVETIADKALAYGKDAGLFEKNSMINKGKDHELEVTLTYDENKINEFVSTVNDAVKVDAQDAQIVISYGNVNITPEVTGKKINTEDLISKIKESIKPDVNEDITINVELEDYQPRITAGELSKIDGIIGSYSGSYVNNNAGRVTNMRLATNSVNGSLLMPGDEFSYNNAIGLTTPENGYQQAGAYVGSEVVQEYGGGVCHISTTLYRAAMRANLRSSLRYNHSMMVSYAEPSLDATVYEGDIDYRFINTYDFPVYIEGYMTANTIVFNIYGNKEAFGNKTYDMVNEVLEEIDYTTEYVDDPTLAEGVQVTKVNGARGYRSKGYLVTYENGVEVSRELISTDYYAPMNTVISRGTKKAQTNVKPSNTESSNSNSGDTENNNNNNSSNGNNNSVNNAGNENNDN